MKETVRIGLYAVLSERLRANGKDRQNTIFLEQDRYGSVYHVPLDSDLVASQLTDQLSSLPHSWEATYRLILPRHTIRSDGKLWDAYVYMGDDEL